jgi:hypothetical protein
MTMGEGLKSGDEKRSQLKHSGRLGVTLRSNSSALKPHLTIKPQPI